MEEKNGIEEMKGKEETNGKIQFPLSFPSFLSSQ
jgi:hypothetical protein